MRRSITIVLVLILGSLPQVAGHAERDVTFPDGSGSVPTYRTDGPTLYVCKPDSIDLINALPEPFRSNNLEHHAECLADGFEHIQAAIDAVEVAGTRILVLPGTYREEPSRAPPTAACETFDDQGLMTYDQHISCPHVQNLVAILGDDPADEDTKCLDEPLCRLQIEGTGASPHDVVIDGAWSKLNVIRADRADGVYLRNFVVQRAEFNTLYVLETDGFAIDTVVGRWAEEYAFLTFAVDHGVVKHCETYGSGDAGVYLGSASDLRGARPSVELFECDSHHNMAGYSGTAGNSVYVHDNRFHHNSVGIAMDSVFPGHPGLPQDSGTFVRNEIFSNNENYYLGYLGDDPPCERPLPERGIEDGMVCATTPVPIGTGIIIAGGNHNIIGENWIYDNWRYGTMLFTVPAVLRDELDPLKQFDTSHFNKQVRNHMGLTPDGDAAPNGLDFWWDEGGAGNCWDDNAFGPGGATSDPLPLLLPDCDMMPFQRPINAVKTASIAPCALWARDNHHPVGCPWMESPPSPE